MRLYLTFMSVVLVLAGSSAFAGLDDLDDLDEDRSEEQEAQKKDQPKKEQAPKLKYDDEADTGKIQSKPIKEKPSKNKNVKTSKPTTPAKDKPKYVSQKKVKTKPEKEEDAEKQPVKVKSKGLRALKNQGVLELKEDVLITQGNLRLSADYAKVYSNKDDDKQVEKIFVRGNVKISKSADDPDDRVVARGNEAMFYNKDRKVVLKGNARLWRGSDLIKGKKIDYDMNTGWITVDSAEGIIDPERSFESEQ